MKDSVIILSGGMDSTTLLYDQQERIALAISFDYGSNHNAREIPFAQLHCKGLGIRHIVIPLEFMSRYFKSSLLEGDDAIPEGHYADENMRSTVVPFRNGIMLSIAVGIAESNGLQHVMMANHGGDHTKQELNKDATLGWTKKAQELIDADKAATAKPLLRGEKREVRSERLVRANSQ